MKMKQQRLIQKELDTNPPYMHTCSCQQEPEYLMELPETALCVNPKYFKRVGNYWEEIPVVKSPDDPITYLVNP